ncbi:MAG TPA: hypothetical protein ENI17_11910 [Pseudomonas xinjiangensis]|uniref:Uncharacterized protein n=2 Tax=root TaxID=1 RepID=A0A7V1BKK5_9GAMM|nr:hypothetical protein [Halopseudomonas xinjiangensis]HEC48317.1 hypothetical protein [Halopseudomonas xinjiangensis]
MSRLQKIHYILSLVPLAKAATWFVLALSGAAAYFSAHKFFITHDDDFVNAFTGAAAVFAAALASLVAFRAAELAEAQLRPYPYPFFDLRSRMGLVLLRIKNAGGSAAHDVYIDWEEGAQPIGSSGGKKAPKEFATGRDNAIRLLLPGESIATMLDVSHEVAADVKDRSDGLRGRIHFKDERGRKLNHQFLIDTTVFSWGLKDETEELKALYSITQLPDQLKEIKKSIDKMQAKP